MNYLAHLYFSPKNPRWMAGNFLADNMRLDEYRLVSREIQKGVQIHRWIDDFTDSHPTFSEHRKRLYPLYGKYAGVVLDIIYDHLLYLNWDHLQAGSFDTFTSGVYRDLRPVAPELPARLQEFLDYFCQRQWLDVYTTHQGMNNVLSRVNKKLSFPVDISTAMEETADYLPEWQEEQLEFLEQMSEFLNPKIAILQSEERY